MKNIYLNVWRELLFFHDSNVCVLKFRIKKWHFLQYFASFLILFIIIFIIFYKCLLASKCTKKICRLQKVKLLSQINVHLRCGCKRFVGGLENFLSFSAFCCWMYEIVIIFAGQNRQVNNVNGENLFSPTSS